MHKSDIYSGSAFVAVALIFIVDGLRLGVSAPTRDGVPGAGFFPVVIGSVVALLGILLIVQNVMSKEPKKESFRMEGEQKDNVRPIVATVAGLLAMFAVWHLVNFELAVVLFSLALNRVYGRSWRFSILFTLVFVGIIYLMFDMLFHIQFDL